MKESQKSLEMNAISFEPDSIDSSTKLTSLFSFFSPADVYIPTQRSLRINCLL